LNSSNLAIKPTTKPQPGPIFFVGKFLLALFIYFLHPIQKENILRVPGNSYVKARGF